MRAPLLLSEGDSLADAEQANDSAEAAQEKTAVADSYTPLRPHPPPPAYSERHSLYVSYFFAAFGDRMWEFASLVFLMSLFPTSLVAASLLGLLETAAAIACSPLVGRLIDRSSRLHAALLSIAGQNVAVCLGGLVLLYLLAAAQGGRLSEQDRWVGWAVLSLCAMAARVASSLNKVSIHKSWVPVLAAPHAHSPDGAVHTAPPSSSALLSSLNGVMRGIDLSSSIVAPLLVGALSSAWNERVASGFIGAWSAASLVLEYHLVQRVWHRVPQLHHKPDAASGASTATTVGWWDAGRLYWHHPLFAPSLAYCLLYVSVLSFGGIMTAYLASELVRLSDALLAVGRALAAVVGLLATLSTPRLIPRLGLVRTGSLLLVCQCACLGLVVAAFALPGLSRALFLALVFVGLCSSRYGLWGFDLVETQLLQEGVAEAVVGVVNGAQEGLMNVCYMLSFALTLVFADPAVFVWPVWISFGSVALAALIYLRWAAQQPP